MADCPLIPTPPNPSILNVEGDPHLRTDGRNRMKRPVTTTYGGAKENPAYQLPDTRSGMYQPDEGITGFSADDGKSILLLGGGTAFLQTPVRSGEIALVEGSYVAANMDSGPIIQGQPIVPVVGGVVRAQANDRATCAVAVAATTIAVGSSGVVYLSVAAIHRVDWTAIIGTAKLSVNVVYYLDEILPGRLKTSSPVSGYLQAVGIGMDDEETLAVKIARPIKL